MESRDFVTHTGLNNIDLAKKCLTRSERGDVEEWP
jgi:hypothetical protein